MTSYYIDAINGNNSNDGLTAATPKKGIGRSIGDDYYEYRNGGWELTPTISRETNMLTVSEKKNSPYTVISLYYSEWQTPGQSYNKTPWNWFTRDGLDERYPLFAKTKDYKPFLYDFSNERIRNYATTSSSTLTSTGRTLIQTATGADPIFYPNYPVFEGSQFRYVRISLRRIAGSAWDGTIFYTTSGHSWSASYMKTNSQPVWNANGMTTFTADMHSLTAGGTDWATNKITGLRLDFGASVSDVFEIASVELLTPTGQSYVVEMTEHDPNQAGSFAREQKVAYSYGIDVFSSCYYWDGTKNFADSSFKMFANHPERNRPKFCIMWAITSSANPISGPFGTVNNVPNLTGWYSLLDDWYEIWKSDKYWFKGGKPVVMAFTAGNIRVSAACNYGFLTSKVVSAHTAGTNIVSLPDVTGVTVNNRVTGTGINTVGDDIYITAINGNNITLSKSISTSLTGVTISIRNAATVSATTQLLAALDAYVIAKPNSIAPNGIHWTAMNDNTDHPDYFGKVSGNTEAYLKTIGFSSTGTYNFFDGYVGQIQFGTGGRSSGTTAGYNFKANYIAAGKDPNTYAYQMDLYDSTLTYAANSGTTIPYFASVMAGWEKTPWTFYASIVYISNVTWLNGVATVSTSTSHGFVTGDKVSLKDILTNGYTVDNGYNKKRVSVTVLNTTQFTFTCENFGDYVSGGVCVKDPDSAHRAATIKEFREHLVRTKTIMDAAPATGTDKTIMIYAWNEFGEGGFICPTRKYGYKMLEAIKTTFNK